MLLIVVAIIIIATFDWNRLKPTINQKVSTELNRPFAIRGDLGVVWERQKEETGWRRHHGDGRNIRRIAQNDVVGVNVRPGDPASPAGLFFLTLPDHAQITAYREGAVQFS